MSFLSSLGSLGGAAAAAGGANAAASGLGHLIGVDPSRIASIAGSIGKGMNQIASAGGAQGGYQDPGLAPQNHLQLLDPQVIQALVQHFSGGPGYRTDVGPSYAQRASY